MWNCGQSGAVAVGEVLTEVPDLEERITQRETARAEQERFFWRATEKKRARIP